MYEIKTEDFYEVFSSDKGSFDFINYSTKSKYYDNTKQLVIVKIKDETGGVAIKEIAELKHKMYSFLADNEEHKKSKRLNRNIVATISHNEYNDVLLNKGYIRQSINRIQSKDHRIGTYEIKNISLSCFHDNIFIQNSAYDRLALGYLS